MIEKQKDKKSIIELIGLKPEHGDRIISEMNLLLQIAGTTFKFIEVVCQDLNDEERELVLKGAMILDILKKHNKNDK